VRRLICTFVVVFVFAALAGCSDDTCPTCPEPPVDGHYSGLAYLSMQFGFQGFYIYDTDLWQIVDSVMQVGYATGTTVMDVSPDGRYLVVLYADLSFNETRIYDTRTRQQITSIPKSADYEFTADGQFLIRSRQGIFSKFSVPSFALISEDTLFDNGVDFTLSAETRSIFAVPDYHDVYQISYDSMKIIREWEPVDQTTGIPIFVYYFDVHPNGNLLYINGSAGYNEFFVYDLIADSVIASYPMYERFGDIGVTPDGSEVWVTDPGRVDIPFSRPEVGTVFIFDAYTGAYTGGVSLYGYINGAPQIALDATRVDFSPDGSEVYISTGAIGPRENSGTFLRIDTRSRELIDNIFPEVDRFPGRVIVGPKPR
jgi:hypothetical protein